MNKINQSQLKQNQTKQRKRYQRQTEQEEIKVIEPFNEEPLDFDCKEDLQEYLRENIDELKTKNVHYLNKLLRLENYKIGTKQGELVVIRKPNTLQQKSPITTAVTNTSGQDKLEDRISALEKKMDLILKALAHEMKNV